MSNPCGGRISVSDFISTSRELTSLRSWVCQALSSSGSSLPDQTGHSGEFLTTNGTTASWAAAGGGGAWLLASGGALTGDNNFTMGAFGANFTGDNFFMNFGNGEFGTGVTGIGIFSISTSDNWIRLTDSRATPRGLEYSGDYSATFSNESLASVRYVLAHAGHTGTMVANRIPYGVSANVLTTSAALAFDGTDILTLSDSTIRSNSGSWLRIGATNGTVQFFRSGLASNVTIFNGAGDNGIVLEAGARTISTGSGSSTLQLAPNAAELVGIGIAPTAKLHIAGSSTARASMNLVVGAAPTSPNDGDMWREDNTNTGLKIRINGVTKTITVS